MVRVYYSRVLKAYPFGRVTLAREDYPLAHPFGRVQESSGSAQLVVSRASTIRMKGGVTTRGYDEDIEIIGGSDVKPNPWHHRYE
jgi:hypothetical protein